jgi:hypothetical protein
MSQVRIVRGEYHYKPVSGVFRVAKPFKDGKRSPFITVYNDGNFPNGGELCRIQVKTSDDFEYLSGATVSVPQGVVSFTSSFKSSTALAEVETTETESEAMDRIASSFSILDQMSAATINGDIRALIVSGPPGVGKSYGVEQQMEKASMFDRLAERKVRYQVVKGATTALGLYAQLYKFSDHKNVLIFDDCDSVLSDELALNILKAALDSGTHRKIFWNSDSALLRREGIPDSFDFNGSVIFITNIKFHNLKSKKLQDHLDALQSRCHFLDLTINTERDKILRIKQVHRDADGGLFANYYFENGEADEIFEFMLSNKTKLRELSLRMCLKIADLVKISPTNWKTLAKATVCFSE